VLQRGHEVVVWNRTSARAADLVAAGAILAASAEEALAASPLSLMCVIDYAAANEVLGSEAARRAMAGKCLVQLSSGLPDEVPVQQSLMHGCGARFLAGGIMVFPSGIGRSDGAIVYAGDADAFEQHRDTLLALGGSLRYLGQDPRTAVGAYCTAGIFTLGSVGLFLETAVFARHFGIPLEAFHDLVRLASDVARERIRDSVDRISTGRVDGDEASVDMILAAMRGFADVFARSGMPARLTDAFTAHLETVSASGAGDKDIAILAEMLWRERTP
jgi:3-hydroxyisobutyrate dehydrogenase-like beta-hydroxyacid dehydrogenase